ncbi:troponin T, skeletal muscle [Caerostris extrusa]|uniref:Troponin T, skeletal muscle n=1 Tax=Caerostris extrusa TaxID=172846 RepID=A0AAV4TVQ0_CAEEX|nr:troponin T, skeletal muscle [Caerostris extrusa]
MPSHPGGFDKMSTVEQARAEMSKSKEQLAEDKQIALTYRVKPLNIEGLGQEKLRGTAEELWTKIVQLESEKYDLEDKMKRQDYDLRELTERQKQINRQKALKKGIDPAEAEGKYPPKISVASKYERRLDRRSFSHKKSWFEEVSLDGKHVKGDHDTSGTCQKIHVASKFERRVDRRTYVDKKSLFDGVCIRRIVPIRCFVVPKSKYCCSFSAYVILFKKPP